MVFEAVSCAHKWLHARLQHFCKVADIDYIILSVADDILALSMIYHQWYIIDLF